MSVLIPEVDLRNVVQKQSPRFQSKNSPRLATDITVNSQRQKQLSKEQEMSEVDQHNTLTRQSQEQISNSPGIRKKDDTPY